MINGGHFLVKCPPFSFRVPIAPSVLIMLCERSCVIKAISSQELRRFTKNVGEFSKNVGVFLNFLRDNFENLRRFFRFLRVYHIEVWCRAT